MTMYCSVDGIVSKKEKEDKGRMEINEMKMLTVGTSIVIMMMIAMQKCVVMEM
jgi:hypothetical protein